MIWRNLVPPSRLKMWEVHSTKLIKLKLKNNLRVTISSLQQWTATNTVGKLSKLQPKMAMSILYSTLPAKMDTSGSSQLGQKFQSLLCMMPLWMEPLGSKLTRLHSEIPKTLLFQPRYMTLDSTFGSVMWEEPNIVQHQIGHSPLIPLWKTTRQQSKRLRIRLEEKRLTSLLMHSQTSWCYTVWRLKARSTTSTFTSLSLWILAR